MKTWILIATVCISAITFSGPNLHGQTRLYFENGDFIGVVETKNWKHRVVKVGQGTTPEALGHDIETLQYPYSVTRCDLCLERLSNNVLLVGKAVPMELRQKKTTIRIVESEYDSKVPISDFSFLIYANEDRLMRYRLTGNPFDQRTRFSLDVKIVSYDGDSGAFGFEVIPELKCGNRLGVATQPETWYFDGKLFTKKSSAAIWRFFII